MEVKVDNLDEKTARIAKMAYFAGVFDGEGCVITQKSSLSLRIQVKMTYLPILLDFQENFGGRIVVERVEKDHWKIRYIWILSKGSGMVAFAKAIIPFSQEKKSQLKSVPLVYKVKSFLANKGASRDSKTNALHRQLLEPIFESISKDKKQEFSDLASLGLTLEGNKVIEKSNAN